MEERPRFSGKFLCAPESLCKVAFTRWYINFLTRKKKELDMLQYFFIGYLVIFCKNAGFPLYIHLVLRSSDRYCNSVPLYSRQA